MAIVTRGKEYVIDLNPLMYKVEVFNMTNRIRVDSFETMRLLIQLLIHNSIEVLANDQYYKVYKSDQFDELLVELMDDFYLTYGLEYGIDYRYSDDKLISYKIHENGNLVLTIKTVVGVIHEDLNDLLGDGDVA